MRDDKGDQKFEPDMPVVFGAEHLLAYLWDVGPVMVSGGETVAVLHSELQAWQSNTGIELRPWEINFLRRLSSEYLSESFNARKEDCPAPWNEDEMTQEQRNIVAKRVQSVMRSFVNVKR
jgi:hypothetical protein